jgi:hypothetical protein
MKPSYLFRPSKEESLINCVVVVKRLATCLPPSSTFNLFLSLNHGTLKIMNRGVPLEGIKKNNLLL